MKPADNVVPISGEASVRTSALPRPKHFKAAQKAAWDDLVGSVKAELLVPENRFTIEMAATLLAKFRQGKPMTATESKELKKQLVALGLAKDDDDASGKGKPRKNAKYFGQQ